MVGQITGKNELKKNGSGYSDPTAYKAIMNVGGATVMNTYHGDIFYIANDGRAGRKRGRYDETKNMQTVWDADGSNVLQDKYKC